jgi:hypothetical protein
MWRAERLRAALALSFVGACSAACVGSTVMSERRRGDAPTSVIRIADERGISDVTTGRRRTRALADPSRGGAAVNPWSRDAPAGDIEISIPLDIRAGADTVRIPGCGVQPFRIEPALRGPVFEPSAARTTLDLAITVPGGDVVIPPGQRRLVNVVLSARGLDPDDASLGIRVDERAGIIQRSGGCPPIDQAFGATYYGLRVIPFEPAGIGVAAALAVLLTVALVGD